MSPDPALLARASELIGRADEGTTSLAALADEFGMDATDLQAELGERLIAICPGCGYWFENIDRDPDDYCTDCR